MKEITLKLKEDNILNFGQEVYVVESSDKGITFKEKCPICEDLRKIVYKGREYDCPECTKRIGVYDNKDYLYLKDWNIVSYTINKVIVEGPEIKSFYQSKNPEGHIHFEGFHKTKNGYSNCRIRNFDLSYLITDEQVVDKIGEYTFSHCFFIDKKLAKKLLKNCIIKNKQELEAFNNFHETNYKYPFEEEK